LTEADGAPLAGRTVTFAVEQKVRGRLTLVEFGTATTDAAGVATLEVPARYVSTAKTPIRATFAGDSSFLGSSGSAFAYRG